MGNDRHGDNETAVVKVNAEIVSGGGDEESVSLSLQR